MAFSVISDDLTISCAWKKHVLSTLNIRNKMKNWFALVLSAQYSIIADRQYYYDIHIFVMFFTIPCKCVWGNLLKKVGR